MSDQLDMFPAPAPVAWTDSEERFIDMMDSVHDDFCHACRCRGECLAEDAWLLCGEVLLKHWRD